MACRRMSFFCRFGQFLPQVVAQQAPQGFHFGRGRFQFSTEKAYSVSTLTPRRAQVSTVDRTGPMPALCPATRGRRRRFGPSAVAVHDDGDVRGQTGGIDGLGQSPIPIPRLESFQ